MVTNRIFVAVSLFSFALFPFAARADVHVSTWAEFKDAVENGDGSTIYLDSNITADLNSPITTYAAGTVIDGQGFKLVGPEQVGDTKVNANFFNFTTDFSKDFAEEQRLKIQNLNLENGLRFSGSSYAYGGAIYNNGGTIGDISGDFSNNYALIENGNDRGYAYGGAIYNDRGTIGNITGNFSNNYAQFKLSSPKEGPAYGGAIDNNGAIGNITGNFSNNHAQSKSSSIYGYAKGGAISNSRTIGDITGNFSDNYTKSETSTAQGGAIYNGYNSIIGDITGDFTNNYAQSETRAAYGGAISTDNKIGNIKGNFTNNYALGKYVYAGGIYASGTIGDITGNFTNNYAQSEAGSAGGAIYASGTIGDISGDFSRNYAQSETSYAKGGAISNSRTIGNIMGIFSGNYAQSNAGSAEGGAIYNNEYGKISSILNSRFYNNYVKTDTTDINNAQGGAIYTNSNLLITADAGKSEFSGNKIIYKDADGNDVEQSEAIYLDKYTYYDSVGSHSYKTIYHTLTLNSINNGLIKIDDGIRTAGGGTIKITGDESSRVELNGVLTDVPTVTVESSNLYLGQDVHYALNVNGGTVNNAVLADANAVMTVEAGAVANNTTVKADASLTAKAQARLKNLLAMGGAVLDIDTDSQLTGDIVIDKDAQLGGSYDYSKIFEDDDKDNGSLTLVGGLNPTIMQADSLITETEAKTLTLSGGDYALGEGTQAVKGWEGLHVKDNAVLKLEGDIELADASKNLHLYNGSVLDLAGHSPSDYTITGSLVNDGSITFSHAGDGADDVTTVKGNYIAQSNAEMTIDVDPVTNTADKLIVEGDVAGTTKVIVNPLTSDQSTDKILFVEALNDNKDTGAYFNIYRVIGDAHVWNSLYEDNRWYLGTDNIIADSSNSGYAGIQTKPEVVSEAIAYGGLANAGIEQTRTLFANVRNNISGDKVYNTVCGGSYACGYDNEALKRVWASPVYSTSKVKAPYKYDADITGLDAGFDIQSDVYNRLGVFASYRKGEYDFKGDSDYFVSKTGSEIDIDSYLGGLYYRYDRGMGHVTAMVYGGIEEADIKTDDGVSAKTDGYVYGAAVEVGRGYAIAKDTILEPGVAVSYTGLKYDDIHDRYGKSAKYDDVSNLEAELYLRAEKNIKLDNGIGKLYLKPAIVHNMGEGKVAITGLDTVDSLKDMTYGRIEAGGSMELTNGWSLYAMIAQAFGSDYSATSINLGLSYAF